MPDLPNPHDRFFKELFSEPEPSPRKLAREVIKLELKTVFPDQEEEIMLSLAEEWILEGEQRGERRGEQKEAAKLTLRQLHCRFGIWKRN